MTGILLFLAGLVIGSFLNVCIHRLPRAESIVRPGSHCPKCNKPVAWFDNIPIVSFFILKGQCRHCLGRISFRYPAVELLSGLIWFASWKVSGGSPFFLISVIFLSILLVVTVTDFETGLIPDAVSFLGAAVGLLGSFFYPELQKTTSGLIALEHSLMGLVIGGGLIYMIGLAGNWIFQRESMGGGDVKLLAMIGSFLGWEKVLLTFFTAPILALPFALYRRCIKKEEIVPYGPFLSLAAAIQFFYGHLLWKLFLGI